MQDANQHATKADLIKLREDFEEHEKSFNEFKNNFSKFEGANEIQQKNIAEKLAELLVMNKANAEHDSAQALLVVELNNTVTPIPEKIKSLEDEISGLQDKITAVGNEITAIQTEKKISQRWMAGAFSVAIILSTLLSGVIGDWLTKFTGG